MNSNFFNVKMHAEYNNKHVSGSERIVNSENVPVVSNHLLARALNRVKTIEDEYKISIKIKKIDTDIQILDSVKIIMKDSKNHNDGISLMKKIMSDYNIPNIDSIINILEEKKHMRGAILLDVDTLQRLEPDLNRGIRASAVDCLGEKDIINKNYYKEAEILATKVANAPNIIGELCISDDNFPDGYITTPDKICYGIRNIKINNTPGGRIFLYRQTQKYTVQDCIDFLENTPVLIRMNKNNNINFQK